MFNKAKRFCAVALSILLIFGISAEVGSVFANRATATVSMEFTGDEADLAGFAQSVITVTPGGEEPSAPSAGTLPQEQEPSAPSAPPAGQTPDAGDEESSSDSAVKIDDVYLYEVEEEEKSYGWIWAVVGGVVALIAAAVITPVLILRKKK